MSKSLQLNLCLEVLPAVIMFKSWHQQSPSMPLSSFMVTWPHASKHLAHQVLVCLRLQKKNYNTLTSKAFPKICLFISPVIQKSFSNWLVIYPIICRVLYIPGGCWGFLPSTVWIIIFCPRDILVVAIPSSHRTLGGGGPLPFPLLALGAAPPQVPRWSSNSSPRDLASPLGFDKTTGKNLEHSLKSEWQPTNIFRV